MNGNTNKNAPFLKSYQVGKNGNFLSLVGGIYNVPNASLLTFYEQYLETVKNNQDMYLVEKITKNFKLYFDIELTDEDAHLSFNEIAEKLKEIINEYFVVNDSQIGYNIVEKESGCKRRCHIYFLELVFTKELALFVINKLFESGLYINKKSIDDSCYNTGLRLLLSKKPYETNNPDKDISAYFIKDISIETLQMYSIRTEKLEPVKLKIPELLKEKKKKEKTFDTEKEDKIIVKEDIIIKILNTLTFKTMTYDKCVRLGFYLASLTEIDYYDDWIDWWEKEKLKYHDIKKAESIWDAGLKNADECQISIGTILFFLKEEDLKIFHQVKQELCNDNIMYISNTDTGIVQLHLFLFPHRYLIDKTDTFYYFNEEIGHWKNSDLEIVFIRDIAFLRNEITKQLELVKLNKTLSKEEKEKMKDKLINIIFKLKGETDQERILRHLKKYVMNREIEMNSNYNVVGFNNGVYDLKEDTFRIGRPEDYISYSVGHDYDPHLDTSFCMKTLQQIMPDPEQLEFYLNLKCSQFLRTNYHKKFIVLKGFGNNGKTVFILIERSAFGDYSADISVDIFCVSLDTSKPNPQILDLKHKMTGLWEEPESNSELKEGFVKKISGGNSIKVRNLHDKNLQEVYPPIITGGTNPSLKFNKYDDALKYRFTLFILPHRFVANPKKSYEFKVDKSLLMGDKLKELGKQYIHILIKNYSKIKDNIYNDFTIPVQITANVEDYFNDNPSAERFFNDAIVEDSEAYIDKKDLKEYYKKNKEYYRLQAYSDFVKYIEFKLDKKFSQGQRVNGEKIPQQIIKGYSLKLLENDVKVFI